MDSEGVFLFAHQQRNDIGFGEAAGRLRHVLAVAIKLGYWINEV